MYALKAGIEELLGHRAWLDLKESTSSTIWKRYVLKVFDAIELSVEATIQIRDADWLSDIRSNLEHGRDLARLAESPEDAISALSATLLKQVFLQLGMAPSRRTIETVPLKRQHWRLDGHRSVQVVQSLQQIDNLFRARQQREIGVDAQFELEAEYSHSRSEMTYADWCAQRSVASNQAQRA